NVILDAISRLRKLASVRVVVSCRTFDLKNDPRLSAMPVDRQFSLEPLPDTEVDRVLTNMIDPSQLLPSHRQLLGLPLHLDIYSRVASTMAGDAKLEPYYTLQELYEALWARFIDAPPSLTFADASPND